MRGARAASHPGQARAPHAALGHRVQRSEGAAAGQAPSAADVKLGSWVSTVKLEEARRRVVDAYKEEGYAFVDVKYVLEQSPDRTRARVRFVVSEGEQVIVRKIVVRGNVFTKSAPSRRIALTEGQPYRASDIRKTEERIATLGAFSSVNVALENPYVPQHNKDVIITVASGRVSTPRSRRASRRGGLPPRASTATEILGQRRAAHAAPPARLHPDAADHRPHGARQLPRPRTHRPARRARDRGIVFPEIGLGFSFARASTASSSTTSSATSSSRSSRRCRTSTGGPSASSRSPFSRASSSTTAASSSRAAINTTISPRPARASTSRISLASCSSPDGETYVVRAAPPGELGSPRQRVQRHAAPIVVSGIEHVDAFPLGEPCPRDRRAPPPQSHFFKLTQTFGGYICLTAGKRASSPASPRSRGSA